MCFNKQNASCKNPFCYSKIRFLGKLDLNLLFKKAEIVKPLKDYKNLLWVGGEN